MRLKYLADIPEQGYYWGINQEIGVSSHRTEENNWNYEMRPILGYKTENWNLTFNPIVGFAISGSDHTPDFSPAIKVSRKVTDSTWVSIEHYSEFGPVDDMRSHVQATYITADTKVFGHELNIGIGHGWTKESDDTTIKAIFNIPL